MTKLEKLVKSKIETLEEFIGLVEAGDNSFDRDFKGKHIYICEYFWLHLGMNDNYQGRLQALKGLIE